MSGAREYLDRLHRERFAGSPLFVTAIREAYRSGSMASIAAALASGEPLDDVARALLVGFMRWHNAVGKHGGRPAPAYERSAALRLLEAAQIARAMVDRGSLADETVNAVAAALHADEPEEDFSAALERALRPKGRPDLDQKLASGEAPLSADAIGAAIALIGQESDPGALPDKARSPSAHSDRVRVNAGHASLAAKFPNEETR